MLEAIENNLVNAGFKDFIVEATTEGCNTILKLLIKIPVIGSDGQERKQKITLRKSKSFNPLTSCYVDVVEWVDKIIEEVQNVRGK